VKAERSSRDDSDGEELESGGNGVDDESLGSVTLSAAQVRQELLSIRGLLGP
jgi:hypothetical protein